MTTRSAVQGKHERVISLVLEVDVDRCTNTYRVAPCTATGAVGTECYNTWATCQAKTAFVRGSVTKKFCSRGTLVPGETVRPYISGSAAVTPTEIVPSKGLAMRSQTSIKLLDEPAPDHLEDPYAATRSAPAQGTWWGRFLARNHNLVGRPARVRQGYVTSPWDWTTFQTSAYIIDAVSGPDADGGVTLVLSDVLKLADRNTLPAPTSGALAQDLKAIEARGYVQSATSASVVLAPDASALDGAYTGMEVYIEHGTGSGQRRVISAYTGATRTATLASAWEVQPVAQSVYQIGALSINVGAGRGAQYADPATSGKAEYMRIGDEVIRYTARAGDVLSWPDATYRAQWGTSASDHKAKDGAQLCRAWAAKRVWEVLRDIFVESGISAGYLDLAGWQAQDTDWFNGAEITTIITAPERSSDLAGELLRDIGAVAWWSPVEQLVKLLANQPLLTAAPRVLTADNLVAATTRVESQDGERITAAALFYGLRNATANKTEPRNYLAGAQYVDADAQSAAEYGDTRQTTSYSRWLGTANTVFAAAVVARRLARLRDAPKKITIKLDPRDEVAMGEQLNITTRRLVDAAGAPKQVTCRIVRLQDRGSHFEATALTLGYRRARYAFIAPNGQPDYLAASAAQRKYAYICSSATGRMSNGDDGYYIP
jgi:hypothetical protein